MDGQSPEYDLLWKDVITELFEEFLLFFAPDLYENVDFSIPPEFREQEFHTILPESESSKRLSDKLIRLQLKGGKEQWVFVHVEVQGSHDSLFSKRMFQTFYRIMDKYDQHIYALALYTNPSSTYNYNQFHQNFMGTSVTYRYHTYRIPEQTESNLLKSHNPFAIAVLAGFYLNKSGQDQYKKLHYKRQLIKLLLGDKIRSKELNRKQLQKLFVFIDHVLRLPKELETTIIQEIKPLVKEEASTMALDFETTFLAKYLLKEAEEEAILKGQKQKALEIATRLIKKGQSIEEIANVTGLPIEEIQKLK